MDYQPQQALNLEWSDYARTAYFASAVPGLEVSVSSEVVFVFNPYTPMIDGNHAALLRAAPDSANRLIERIIRFYQERDMTPGVVLSPACTPSDLPERLAAHGFKPYGDPEYWLVLENCSRLERLKPSKNLDVREIEPQEISDFCRVMAAAFEMPAEAAPLLEHFFGSITGLEGVKNYLAYQNNLPAGCISLFSYQGYSAVGSAGLLPGMNSLDAGLGMMARIYQDWKQTGTHTLLLQTTLPKVEKGLRLGGFKRAFTRSYYILE